jgi:rare lipoprotein A
MAIFKKTNCLIIFLCISFISACSHNTGRYQQKHDSTPNRLPSSSELHNATPRAESHSRGGNKHYQVRGKHYQVLKSAENFTQTGVASWYGRKFHGHLTSNGEIYDMYAMSAAHKNLPLPTYLNVVNNDNGKSVIVRVNDRGPFHESRIIDLSYSAAYKLDMLKTGTANVSVTAITDFSSDGLVNLSTNAKITPLPKKNTAENIISTQVPAMKVDKQVKVNNEYIQVFASKSQTQAHKLANVLSTLYQQNTQLEQINGIFRVLIGPIKKPGESATLLLNIKSNGYPKAFIRK